MAMIKIQFRPTTRDLRQFGMLVMPILLAVIGLVAWFKFQAGTVAAIAAGLAVVFFAVGAFNAENLRFVYILWMGLIFPVGWLISHLAMGAIFYLLFTPIGLLMRLMGRRPIEKAPDRSLESYWESRPPHPAAARYFRKF